MVWIIIIVVVVGIILYKFFRDRDQMLRHQVDAYGGMEKKYEHLISQLTTEQRIKVIKVTRDHLHIRAQGQMTAINFLILENFDSVEIEWVAQLGLLGTHRHKWTFIQNYPQEKMLEEMKKYLELKNKELFGDRYA